MRFTMMLLLWTVLLPSVAQAETAYITDRLFVSIREGQGNESPAVKSVATGTELEVLQRLDGYALVREPGGAEGWLAERYLVDTAPGKAQLDVAQNELQQANSELSKLKSQLADTSKKAKEANTRASALEKKLTEMGAAQENRAESDSSKAADEGAETTNETIGTQARGPASTDFYFSWLWLLIAFAMLVTGFIAGVTWLRELNRKKMGGMYLRI